MITITEDYVSFETAKLLKDKGFDTAVRYYYQKIDDDITYHIEDFRNWNVYDMWYSMPTLQMAMKWLREVHKKWISITFHWHTVNGETTLYYSPFIMSGEREYEVLKDENPFKIKLFNSYEEAVEAAIKYCLENLV